MRSTSWFVSCCLVALGVAGCGTARDDEQTGSTFCFNCHSETTEMGEKIEWAQAGYDRSVHKNGQVGRIYTFVPDTLLDPEFDCTPFENTACYRAVGTEFEGTNAFYANSAGCQICHTQEGFRKRVAGEYDPADGAYSIRFGWDRRAGAATTANNTDVIRFPSPLGCFGCHTPHGVGTADGVTLDQTVPRGQPITLQTGAVYGANKQKGHICAECHQIRLNDQASTIDSIVATVTSTATSGARFNVSSSYGPHHGPQADMLLGVGGAQYSGTAGGFTFAGTYNNSAHTGRPDADCISCHMQDDYSDINVTGRFGVNASVGGHSFTNKGFVHGEEKALVIGCGSVTSVGGCHTVAGVAGSSGFRVQAANVGGASGTSAPTGYLQTGDAYFQLLTGTATTAAESNYQNKVNELLTKLADPADDCAGLLDRAAQVAAGRAETVEVHAWNKMVDEFTTDPRCISAGTTTGNGVLRVVSPVDNNTNATVRFVKALFNYKYVREDKSFGVHNTRYALQLLYDSCTDLTLLTGGSCGSTPGQCTACQGTFVTARP